MDDAAPNLYYSSSYSVRCGISNAYSIKHNSRGMEMKWYTPYSDTLRGVVAALSENSKDENLLIHVQHPMWIPGLQMRETQLRKEFQDADIDYSGDESDGESDDQHRHHGSSDSDMDVDSNNPLQYVASRDSLRSSRRVQEREVRDQQLQEKQRKDHISKLKLDRKVLWKDQAQVEKDKHHWRDVQRKLQKSASQDKEEMETTFPWQADNKDFEHGLHDDALDISFHSDGSMADCKALNECPDIYVEHVECCQIPQPIFSTGKGSKQAYDQATMHYTHRAGLKIYHTCGVAIVELKPGPTRRHDRGSRRRNLNIEEAITDLMEYCALYFNIHNKARYVVAIAGSGPYWKWRRVESDDVPDYDWNKCVAMDYQEGKIKAFETGFSDESFQLGTTLSDAEMCRVGLAMKAILIDGHTPPRPTQGLVNTFSSWYSAE